MAHPENDKLALGIDIGGTNIRAALVTRNGDIIHEAHRPTPHNPDGDLPAPDTLTAAVVDCAAPLLADVEVLGVGVGSGGQFNPMAGAFRGINTNRPEYVGYPFRDELAAGLNGLPVFVDNDVKMAAYGELTHGAGQAYQHLLAIAVGTGIGGAVILNRTLFHGRSGLAGHIGQLPHPDTGEMIERVAGGVWLGRRAIAAGLLSKDETTADLFAHARHGNRDATQFITDAATVFGRVLAGFVHTLEPEAILMGGSVGIQPEYLAAVNDGLQSVLLPAWQNIHAHPMQLGERAGRIGAASFVYDALTD